MIKPTAFVDNLMHLSKLSLPEIDYIKKYYDQRIDETGAVLSDAARVISDLTQYVSIVTPPKATEVNVSSIQLMPVNPLTAMVVLLTDTGMVQNTPITLPRAMTQEELDSMSRLLNKMFAGKSVNEIHPGAQFMMENEIADQKQLFDTICAVLEARLDRVQSRVVIDGASKVLAHQEFTDLEKARGFLKLLEEKQKLGEIVNEDDSRITVRIVTATYSAGNKTLGKIGVIGPTRMQYDKVLSVLDQMGKTLSRVFTETTALEEKTSEREEEG